MAVLVTGAFAALAFMTVSDSAATIFEYFVNLTSVASLMDWGCIFIAYIGFYRAQQAQGFDRSILPFRSRTAYGGAIFSIILVSREWSRLDIAESQSSASSPDGQCSETLPTLTAPPL